MDFMERYLAWCNAGLPEDVKSELASISNDIEELKGRFGGDLQFQQVVFLVDYRNDIVLPGAFLHHIAAHTEAVLCFNNGNTVFLRITGNNEEIKLTSGRIDHKFCRLCAF